MRILVLAAVMLVSGGWALARRWAGRGWQLLLVLVCLPALLLTGNELRWYRFESALADAARPALGERDAAFHCERVTRNAFASQGHVGHVRFAADGTPDDAAFLSSGTCAALRGFRRRPDAPSLREVVAVHTLTHEEVHLTGERRESAAECRALALDEQVMRRLGASAAAARAATRRYLREVHPRLPEEYLDAGCRAALPVPDQVAR